MIGSMPAFHVITYLGDRVEDELGRERNDQVYLGAKANL